MFKSVLVVSIGLCLLSLRLYAETSLVSTQVSTHTVRDFATYERSNMILRRDFADDLPFYLSVPKTKELKGIVFLLHGITSSKDIWWQNEGPYSKLREYRTGLLESGYVLVTPDARWHGQRSYMADFTSPLVLLSKQNWSGVRQLIEGSANDFKLIMTYVQQAYPDLPLGVLGMSLGALQTLVLAANESRVEFAVPIFPPIQGGPPSMSDIDPNTLANKIQIPTLLLISDRDVWYTFEAGKQLYEEIASQEKQLLVLSTRHELDYSEAEKVVQWINLTVSKLKAN